MIFATRGASILVACLCLAGCGADAPPRRERAAEAPARPAATPATKKDSASVERRQRRADESGRDSTRRARMQGLGDAMPSDSPQQKAP